jgi:hypothetical protein
MNFSSFSSYVFRPYSPKLCLAQNYYATLFTISGRKICDTFLTTSSGWSYNTKKPIAKSRRIFEIFENFSIFSEFPKIFPVDGVSCPEKAFLGLRTCVLAAHRQPLAVIAAKTAFFAEKQGLFLLML